MGKIADSIKRGRPRKHPVRETPRRDGPGRPPVDNPRKMRSLRFLDADWDKLGQLSEAEQTTRTGWIERRIREG